jgi:hypothetical protein
MYPKALDKMLQALVRISDTNQVQLFVTTHRPEVLASLVEHGKQNVAIFHFSRKNGEVRAKPSLWNDTKILSDIGWDIGKLVKGYEKYVIVEGDRDRLVFDESCRKLTSRSPESLWITVVPAGGISNFSMIVKALIPTGREIFAIPDLDKNTPSERISQLIQSMRQLLSEGYSIKEREQGNGVTISSEKIMTTLTILPSGDPNGLKKIGYDFESFSVDDYVLELIVRNPSVRSTVGVTEEQIEESKRSKNAKSVLSGIMGLDDKKTRSLINDCELSEGLKKIVATIVGDLKSEL